MLIHSEKRRNSLPYRILCGCIAFSFIFTLVLPPQVAAQIMPASVLNLPVPGTMVTMSSGFIPPLVKGITIHPENPLMFDFIVDSGESYLEGEELKAEADKMIKYFLASLTVPEDEMWVNLSPYEKDRIIPDSFGLTMMGRDLLAQDYLLKQLTASLMYPEEDLGSKFWTRVYDKAYEMYGTTEIPMNTFNKIWIIPETAVVFEKGNSAYVVESHLKVMLEEDYLALQENIGSEKFSTHVMDKSEVEVISGVTSQVVKEVLIPEIEREVNEGETFANLRQIYNSMILATWFKKNLKDSLLGQVYVDKNKTKGVDVEDKQIKQKIYDQYVEAFSKGVYNYIKEDIDPVTNQMIPRKYFSGGFTSNLSAVAKAVRKEINLSPKQRRNLYEPSGSISIVMAAIVENAETEDEGKGYKTVTHAASSPIETYGRISPFLWKEGPYGWGEGEQRELGRLRVGDDGILVADGEIPEIITNIIAKATDHGLRFNVEKGSGVVPLIIGGKMTVIEGGGNYLRPLVELEQEGSSLMLHPIFLEYYRGTDDQQRDVGLSGQERTSLENILMLSLVSGVFKSLGHEMVNENLLENLAVFAQGSDYFTQAVEDAINKNIGPVSVYHDWIRDYVRFKFRKMMSSAKFSKAGDMLQWFNNNHRNEVFGQAFEEILIQHLYNDRRDYRDTAGWILAQPQFHGGVFYTDAEVDRSVRNILATWLKEESVDNVVETFHGVGAKKQRQLIYDLWSIIEKEEGHVKAQAQRVFERIFDITPLNTYRFGDPFISQNIARTRAGDEAQRVYTKKEPLTFKLRYSENMHLDFDAKLVINSQDSDGYFEKTVLLGDRVDLGVDGYLHEKQLNTSNYYEALDVSVVIEIDGKNIVVGKRHFDEAVKDVVNADDYKPVTHEKIAEITGKNAVIAVAEAQVFYDKLAETMAGGLGALESSFLRAYPYTGVNAHFMLWMYENGSRQTVDENGLPKFEDVRIKEEYLEAIKDYTEEVKEITINLGVENNPEGRETHTIRVHKVKLPVEGRDDLFTYVYMLENAELAERIYPGGERDFVRQKQTVAYAHAVAETMVVFNIEADIVQAHEAYSGFVPFIMKNHPRFKNNDVFKNVNHIAFSHSMISTTIPKFPKERNWLLGMGGAEEEEMNRLMRAGEVDPFFIAGSYAKKIGVVGNEHRSVMIRSTYPEFADKYVAINDSMYSGYWAMDEIVDNNFELFKGKEVWDVKQKKMMELIEFIENETRGTAGEITRDDIIVKVKNRNGDEVDFIPPIVVDGIRRWIDYKNNLMANQMPGRNGVSGYEYLAQLAFIIKGGPAHPNNFQTGDVVNYGQAGWMYQLKNEIMPKVNRDKKRMALVRYTQQTAKKIWNGANMDVQTSLPYFEAYGVAFMKAMINYGLVISTYTGGPIENVVDAVQDPDNGNGYLVMPYSPDALQNRIEEAVARYYAYFSFINDVDLTELIKNNDYVFNLAKKYHDTDPERILRFMRNAAAMVAKVDTRRGAEAMVKEMWLPAINGEAASSPISDRSAQWRKSSMEDPTLDWPILSDQENTSSPIALDDAKQKLSELLTSLQEDLFMDSHKTRARESYENYVRVSDDITNNEKFQKILQKLQREWQDYSGKLTVNIRQVQGEDAEANRQDMERIKLLTNRMKYLESQLKSQSSSPVKADDGYFMDSENVIQVYNALVNLKSLNPNFLIQALAMANDPNSDEFNNIGFVVLLKKADFQLLNDDNTMSAYIGEIIRLSVESNNFDDIQLASFSELAGLINSGSVDRKGRKMDIKSILANRASTSSPVGGIDLNPELLDLQIRRDGNGVPLPLLRQPIQSMEIEGFLPVIINVTPVTNLPFLLGLTDDEEEPLRRRSGYDLSMDVGDLKTRLEELIV